MPDTDDVKNFRTRRDENSTFLAKFKHVNLTLCVEICHRITPVVHVATQQVRVAVGVGVEVGVWAGFWVVYNRTPVGGVSVCRPPTSPLVNDT